MPDLPISSAAAFLGSALAADDYIPVLDTSAPSGSKGSRMVPSELFAGLLIRGNTALGPNTASGSIALGTITDTTSRPLCITQTWNNSGLTATALKVAVTNTSSNAASKLLELCSGSAGTTSVFSVTAAGLLTTASNIACGSLTILAGNGISNTSNLMLTAAGGDVAFSSNYGGKSAWAFRSGTGDLNASSDAGLGWTGTAAAVSSTSGPDGTVDVKLVRDAAGVLALKVGTTAQKLRIYGTTTGSKYLTMEHDGTNAKINTSSGDLHISSLPTSNPGPGILWNNAGTPAIGT